MPIPSDPDQLLPRRETAQALTEAGFPTSAATLATMVSRGGGPPYRLFGRKPLYRWADALQWAQAKLGPVVRSSSELDEARNLSARQGETNTAAIGAL